jgi:S-adenosylmethionine:tRNA ribosyltransferase-isomerase
MHVSLFDFELPEERIALHPAEPRDSARMLVVRPGQPLEDQHVTDLLDILRPGDVLVVNDTKVLPAELKGTRIRGEARATVSFNLHKRVDSHTWRAFARPAKRLHLLDRLELGDDGSLLAAVAGKGETGEVTLEFDLGGAELDEAIKAHGAMPLPPYIEAKRRTEERDKTDYQTVYAAVDGAVAAPTAGLHFTQGLLQKLSDLGVAIERVTLHVGAGTFLPMKADDTDDHVMHAEWGELTEASVHRLREAKAKGGRIIAGFRFRAVDMLMTNFHLPKSTLFMLVSAFAGLETMQAAYAHAIRFKYRFYSYGDSSLLFRQEQSEE